MLAPDQCEPRRRGSNGGRELGVKVGKCVEESSEGGGKQRWIYT
jgi:hypothetical protein